MSVNLRALIARLNDESRRALESAAGLCLSRTHYDVEIEHYLMKALDDTAGDVAAILKHYGVDRSRLASELTRSLDKLKTGNARNPSFSPTLVTALTEAWTIGSLEFSANRVRTGHVMLALRSVDELARLTRDVSKELEKISAEGLRKEFASIVSGTSEDAVAAAAPEASEPGVPRVGGKTPNLDQFTICLLYTSDAADER